MNYIISKYIEKLKVDDIYKFAKKNDIYLTNNEANVIFKTIKNHWNDLIFNDYKVYLKKIKNEISNPVYLKLEELIEIYKEKYKDYL